MVEELLINNADLIATFDSQGREIRNGYLLITGKQIEEVGPMETWSNRSVEKMIDATGKIVLPGLINVHHHLFQTLTRVLPSNQKGDIFEWLKVLYPLWYEMNPEITYRASQVGMAELLLSGCTTTADHFFMFPKKQPELFGETIAAAKDLGIRFHPIRGSMTVLEGQLNEELTRMGIDVPSMMETEEEVIHNTSKAIEQFHDLSSFSMCRVGLGPSAIPYGRTEFLKKLKKLAIDNSTICHTHLHPRVDEDPWSRRTTGWSPLEYLENIRWLGPETYLAHVTSFQKKDIEGLARTRTGVAHCPSSNLRVGYQVAPLPQMLEAGVRVGIGVDGSAANDTGDMIGELRMALLVHRGKGIHSEVSSEKWPSPRDILKMATRTGAEILGRDDIGSLEKGKAADIVIFNRGGIDYIGSETDPLSSLILCGLSHRVDTAIVNGRLIVENGELTQYSEKTIAQEGRKAALELQDRVHKRTGIPLKNNLGR